MKMELYIFFFFQNGDVVDSEKIFHLIILRFRHQMLYYNILQDPDGIFWIMFIHLDYAWLKLSSHLCLRDVSLGSRLFVVCLNTELTHPLTDSYVYHNVIIPVYNYTTNLFRFYRHPTISTIILSRFWHHCATICAAILNSFTTNDRTRSRQQPAHQRQIFRQP